jgi:hypothetical protein
MSSVAMTGRHRVQRTNARLELHFGNSDVDLDDAQHIARLRDVFQASNTNRMAIVVHMRSSVTRQRPYGAAQARMFLGRVLPAAPDVPVQIAHLATIASNVAPYMR